MRILPRALLVHWPSRERNALLGASQLLFGSSVMNAAWHTVPLPVQQTFGLGVDGEVLLRQLPDIAGLIAVPLVGALGTGVSTVRLAAISAACALSGALLMTFAPAIGWLVVGMCMVSVGRSVVSVLALSVVASSIKDAGRRTSAFATLGAAIPTAYIIAPVLAGWLLGLGGWRWVGCVWIAGALILLASTRWFRDEPRGPVPATRKEPWTPILAGVTLVCIVQAFGAVSLHGVLSVSALGWIAGTVAAAGAWFGLVRVLPDPSMGGATLRTPGLLPMLVVAMVAQCGDLRFYVDAVARFVHRLTPLEVSLALLAGQFAALAGAGVAGWLIRRIGIRQAGVILIGWFAASMWLSCAQSTTSPLWVTVGVFAVSAVAEVGSGVCLIEAIMSKAPGGLERQVSSYQRAAMGVGNALTLLLVTSTVSYSMGASMRRHVEDSRDITPEQVEALVDGVEDNTPTATIVRELGLGPDRLDQLREVRRGVIIDGVRIHGVVSGAVLSVAAIGFWVVCRPARTERSSTP
jgi:MFS family permease